MPETTATDSVIKLLWDHDPSVLDELKELGTGMENYPSIDQDWVWVAWEDGKIVASLFAAPAHGTVILLRLNSKAKNPMTLLKLFRIALGSMKERGYSLFFSFLDATQANELKLAKLAQHYGCQLMPFSGFIACGQIRDGV